MKKYGWILIAATVLLLGIYVFGMGFTVCTSVYIDEFEVAADGGSMTLHAGNASSVGYLRSVTVKEQDGVINLTFYPAFGGINGRLGAKSEFVIPLSEDSRLIRLNKGGEYQNVLLRDPQTGEWIR